MPAKAHDPFGAIASLRAAALRAGEALDACFTTCHVGVVRPGPASASRYAPGVSLSLPRGQPAPAVRGLAPSIFGAGDRFTSFFRPFLDLAEFRFE